MVRAAIYARVKAGMRRAALDGKHLGRKAEIAREMSAGVGTVYRAYQRASKKVSEDTSVSA